MASIEPYKPLVNALTTARDRGRTALDDVSIIDFNNHSIKPMVTPSPVSSMPPMARKFGETTIDQRRNYGSNNMWANTPVMLGCPEVLGDPDILDVTDILADFDDVGWAWSKKNNCLKAYLTTRGKTFVVKIPLKKLQRIFNKHVQADNGTPNHFRETSLEGFFKKLGRGIKKLGKHIVKSTIKGITAPFRFIKNPKKFIKDTGQDIKKLVKGVGKTALKVASSPIFAGVMTAIAAIPPLTVVGGIGLAAFAAANAIKPAFKALEKGIDVVDAVSKKKPGRAIQALTSGTNIKAESMTKNFTSGFNSLPGPAKQLMTSALKSTENKMTGTKNLGKLAIRFKAKK